MHEPVRRLPDAAGAGDALAAGGPALRECDEAGGVPEPPSESLMGELPRPRGAPLGRNGRQVCEEGAVRLEVAYETYGRLNEDGDNAILVCHALTGSAHAGSFYAADGGLDGPEGWWDPLIGPGRALDTERFYIICSNFLGSCYGTTGPTS